MTPDSVLRVVDVNFNRAAEGLRTIEDIARVVGEDSVCAAQIKSLRHGLGDLASRLPRLDRLASRSVHSDAGIGLTHPSESYRQDWNALVSAACERVTQSLRVIEEASKVDYPWLATATKQLRYQAYDQLAQVESRLAQSLGPFQAAPLYLLIDCSLPIDSFAAMLRELDEAGVGLFQIRDKHADGAQLLKYARAAIEQVGRAKVIINDRVDIALASGAGGVHVGQDDLPLSMVQQLARGTLHIGVSTHDIQQARQAQQDGADYIGCGPTFPSSTKQFEQFAGIEFLRQVAAEIQIPAYAIGGITAENVPQVRLAGLSRIAVSGTILSAANPKAAAQNLAGTVHGLFNKPSRARYP
jgi:thiamine-phosphate pyrophosphorylase